MVLLAAGGLILLRVFDPAQAGIFPPCPVHYLTGLYCPGCGSLRAMHSLLHGDVRRAWAMNPLAMTLLPFIGYGLASEVCTHFRGRALQGMMLSATSIRVLCAIIVLFGVVRNLPLHPFDWLAPGALLHL
jgi:hypothetical protein